MLLLVLYTNKILYKIMINIKLWHKTTEFNYQMQGIYSIKVMIRTKLAFMVIPEIVFTQTFFQLIRLPDG